MEKPKTSTVEKSSPEIGKILTSEIKPDRKRENEEMKKDIVNSIRVNYIYK